MQRFPFTRIVLAAWLLLGAAPVSRGHAAPLGATPGESDQVVVVEADGGSIPPPPAQTVVLVHQAPPVPPVDARPAARHSLYVEGVTAILANSISVNYSFRPIKIFAFSAGVGASSMFFISEFQGVGGQVQAHLLLGRMGDSNFELSAGVALIRTTFRFLTEEPADPSIGALPAFSVGYRYQPMDGGLLFRIGGAWSYGFGMGLQASIGATF